MRGRSLVILAFGLAACRSTAVTSNSGATPEASGSAGASASSSASSMAIAPRRVTSEVPRWVEDEPIQRAFWTSQDTLVAASQDALWHFAAPDAPPTRTPTPIATLYAKNGADTFVTRAPDGRFTLWSEGTKAVVPIDHRGGGAGGDVSRNGARVVLGGCDAGARCARVYDGRTGNLIAQLTTAFDVERLDLTDDAAYIVARGAVSGLSVFDAASGKNIATRPGWQSVLPVHGWNRPDLAEIVDARLIVGQGDVVDVVDLTTGKVIATRSLPGRTLAVFGPKKLRVVLFSGAAGKVQVWDVAADKLVRAFNVTSHVARGADCTHCALEIDEGNEDRIWLTSAYTNDRLALHVDSGTVERVEEHSIRSPSIPSATHRVGRRYDRETRTASCVLERRDGTEPPRQLPIEMCDPTGEMPYPGFSPSGKQLATIDAHELRVLDVARLTPTAVIGRRDAPRPPKPGPKPRRP